MYLKDFVLPINQAIPGHLMNREHKLSSKPFIPSLKSWRKGCTKKVHLYTLQSIAQPPHPIVSLSPNIGNSDHGSLFNHQLNFRHKCIELAKSMTIGLATWLSKPTAFPWRNFYRADLSPNEKRDDTSVFSTRLLKMQCRFFVSLTCRSQTKPSYASCGHQKPHLPNLFAVKISIILSF